MLSLSVGKLMIKLANVRLGQKSLPAANGPAFLVEKI